LKIEVVSGTGQGPTDLAAFDAAELTMGVGDCNLIRMSSIIPPGSEVVSLDGPTQVQINWGDRVYCIYAEAHTRTLDEEAWAGVGWFFLEEEAKGIFCEHVGANKAEVERRIHDSLTSFMKVRNLEPNEDLFHKKITGITCTGQPVCALAMAVYRAVGWD
jgi:arginine decarboxylase